MNDAPNEDLIPLSQAHLLVEKITDEVIDKKTCYNWANRGLEDASGTRHYLKTVRRVGRRATTKEWIIEFLEKIT